jgi:hypothetical protein
MRNDHFQSAALRYAHLQPILATEDETLVLGKGLRGTAPADRRRGALRVEPRQGRGTDPAGRASYPDANLRRLDLVDERGLNRITQLGTRSLIERQQNVVFQGVTRSRKSYLRCVLAKQACQHRIRAHYVRMPDLEEAWALAKDKPQGQTKFLKKYATFTLLVIDEWLLDHPDEGMRSMLLELLERRYDTASTVL